MTDVVALTQQLVRIDSSDPGAYEGEIGAWLHGWLKEAIERQGLGDVATLRTLEALPGRRCLMATIPGRAQDALALVCHQDTVTLGDGWSEGVDPVGGDVRDGQLWGRGACDMKGGMACALLAFKDALAETGRRRWEATAHGACACGRDEQELAGEAAFEGAEPWLPERPLKLILTVDEEDFMRGIEAAIDAGWVGERDWLLDTEPTDGKVRVAHKGRLWFEFHAEGVTAHASTPWRGADAVAAMAQAIVSLRTSVLALPEHHELGRTTITFGQIEGGYRPYVVPDQCRCWVDVRHVPPASSQLLKGLADEACRTAMEAVPGTDVTYTVTGDRPPVERDPESGLVSALERAAEQVTGAAAPIDVFTGYTDTAVCAGLNGNREIASYGPGSLEVAHKPDEHVPVQDLQRVAGVFKRLVLDVCFEQ